MGSSRESVKQATEKMNRKLMRRRGADRAGGKVKSPSQKGRRWKNRKGEGTVVRGLKKSRELSEGGGAEIKNKRTTGRGGGADPQNQILAKMRKKKKCRDIKRHHETI